MSDRVLVISGGRLTGEIDRADAARTRRHGHDSAPGGRR